MSQMHKGEAGSCYTYLSKGCRLCQLGSKMVLFVTGMCGNNCFYCPLSDERKKDMTFANERIVTCDEDIINEALQMDALGTGITGGEPLLKLEKTLNYIKLLKSYFGKKHHIHLYTSIPADDEMLLKLSQAGLDEIRFHPPIDIWEHDLENYINSIQNASKYLMETGFELPGISGLEKIIEISNKLNCFVNINELEFADNNAKALKLRNYKLRNEYSNSVEGSYEISNAALGSAKKIHLCTSRYKDSIQLRKRLLRMAHIAARKFDEITTDGTLIYGIIHCSHHKQIEIIKNLLIKLDVPEEMYMINSNEIHIDAWVLENIIVDVKNKINNYIEICIVEKYPFENGVIVEKISL